MKVGVFITNKEDIHHITNVMRNTIGNQIIITFKDKIVLNRKLLLLKMNQLKLN